MHRVTVMLFLCLAGCRQQSSAPFEEVGQETPVQQAPERNVQGGDAATGQETLTLKGQTEGVRSVNEQDETVEVDLVGPQTSDVSLVQLEGLTNLQELNLGYTEITNAGRDLLCGVSGMLK